MEINIMKTGTIDPMALHEQTSNVVNLDDRILNKIADATLYSEAVKDNIIQSVNSKSIISPDELLNAQQKTLTYSVEIGIINSIVRKGVSTVETLLRS